MFDGVESDSSELQGLLHCRMQVSEIEAFQQAQDLHIRALAEWQFGGGGSYCGACTSPCDDCPLRVNAPQTVEGLQVWELAQRCARQLRVVGGGFGPPSIVGFDYAAVFRMADAMGIALPAVAELLPIIEAAAIPAMNEQMRTSADG